MIHRNIYLQALIYIRRGHHAQVTSSVAELSVPILWNFGM